MCIPEQFTMKFSTKEHSPAFTAKVALAALKGRRSIPEIARQFAVSEADVLRWRRHLSMHASDVMAFTAKTSPFGGVRQRTTGELPVHSYHSYSRSVVYWSRILETLYNRQFVAAMRSGRVSVSFWRILSWLSELGTLTVGEIAAHSQIERTVLSRLLERMADDGLITRVPRRGDRRISETRITAKGRQVVRTLRPQRQSVYSRATDGIAPRHLEFVCAIIIRMIDNLGGHKTLFATDSATSARGLLDTETR